MRVWVSIATLALLAACAKHRTRSDAGTDTGACVEPPSPRDLDVLFVIEGDPEDHASLADQLPRFLAALGPVGSVQLGVVTGDMGTGGFPVTTCSEELGDDGVLRTVGNTSVPDCMETYPPFLTYAPSTGSDPNEVASDLGCIARRGTGCGWEQPLEALLKAVAPSTSGIAFQMRTRGHGDGANRGFLRPDSILVVIVLHDEDDCSVSDPEIFNPMSTEYTGNLNLRCFSYPSALHPVQRYVDGLLALREDPRDIVYATIAGIPPEIAGTSYESILAHDLMQEVVDPSDPNRLLPSCNVPGRGLAFPPRRLVTVARELDAFGASTTAQSICQAGYIPVFDGILAAIDRSLGPRCP